MDIEAIQTKVLDVVKALTKLPTHWKNQKDNVMVPKLVARVELDGPLNIEPVGEDEVQYVDAFDDDDLPVVNPTVVGQREFDITVRVVSRSQTGNKTSQYWLELLRTALRRPSVTLELNDAGLAVLTIGKSASFDAPFEERWESIAIANLRLSTVVVDIGDSASEAITQIALSSDIDNVDGEALPSPPNLDDVIITG